MEGLPGDPVHRPRRRAGGRPAGVLSARRLVLLRHGRTASNAEGRIQGQLDTPLDELGRRQADALGTAFEADPPSVVVSSDLSRAADTARAVAAHVGLEVSYDPRLRESHFGDWQGLTGAEVDAGWPQESADWRAGRRGPVGGESPEQVADRAQACVDEVLPSVPEGRTLMLVSHGGTARALVGRLLGLPADQWWLWAPLGNTCWTTLVESPRGWRVERHNAGLGPLVGPPTGAA